MCMSVEHYITLEYWLYRQNNEQTVKFVYELKVSLNFKPNLKFKGGNRLKS